MLHDMLPLLSLLHLCSQLLSVSAYQWPGDTRHATLERFIYEGVRPDASDMFGILGNCTLIPRANHLQSTTTAARWLRMAYHDSATFNITDQTGGVDGSIHFELDRAENIGDGLKTTQAEYSGHSNKFVSLADVIAIGAVGAIVNCGGPSIPMRTGRVDAKQAGNPGVPEPHQDLQTHIQKFRLQGFNPTEMIELVACGHTLGGVESKDFPTIVDQPTHLPTFNTDSISAPFDNTTAFDTTVVTQYLNDRTQNPLVVGKNDTTRSDLRIFSSDGNVTMRALADPATFQSRCGVLLERMINTVPSGVKLTERIDVIPAIPHHYSGLHIVNGSVTLMTSLRLAQAKSDPAVDISRVYLHWCDRYGADANCQSGFSNRIKSTGQLLQLRGSPFMVRLQKEFRIYPFNAPIQPSRSISRFWWELEQQSGAQPDRIDNEGEKYPVVQDDIIYVTRLSSTILTVQKDGSRLDTYSIVIGVRDIIEPTRVYLDLFDYAHGGRKPGSLTNETFNLVPNSSLTGAPGYNLYSVIIDSVSSGGGATLDFHVEALGKNSSLTLQHMASAASLPDDRFIVDIGSVERVAYTGAPVAVIPSPTPTALGGVAIHVSVAPLHSICLALATLALLSGSFI